MSEHKRYIVTPFGFFMVLRRGDDVLLRLDEDIPSASVFGFGFAGNARFGFFNFDRSEYEPHEFKDLEITGLTGTLAWKDGEPAIHAHASGGDRTFSVVGGHLLSLTVGRGSFEITVITHSRRLYRRLEPAIGANVLQLD